MVKNIIASNLRLDGALGMLARATTLVVRRRTPPRLVVVVILRGCGNASSRRHMRWMGVGRRLRRRPVARHACRCRRVRRRRRRARGKLCIQTNANLFATGLREECTLLALEIITGGSALELRELARRRRREQPHEIVTSGRRRIRARCRVDGSTRLALREVHVGHVNVVSIGSRRCAAIRRRRGRRRGRRAGRRAVVSRMTSRRGCVAHVDGAERELVYCGHG